MTPRPGILGALARLFRSATRDAAPSRTTPSRTVTSRTTPSQLRGTETVEVPPPGRAGLRITYAPSLDGDPDAGEIIWTWVPYDENDGRGKDRPVLVVGRESAERVYAVRLTSKAHDRDRDYLAIGAGPWDSQGRPSWVDIEQVYSVHVRGMRREASALDLDRFTRVAAALQKRYGWTIGT